MKTKMMMILLAGVFSLTLNASSAHITASMIAPTTSHRTFYECNEMADSVKWECDYDDMGRLVLKAGYVLSDATGEWTPRVAYTLYYGDEETVVTTAKWDARHSAFRSHATQQRYSSGNLPQIVSK